MSLKELIKINGLTQSRVAAAINVRQQRVSKWCCGVCKPQSSKIKQLAQALNVSVETILDCFEK